jgi:nucleoside-diphosphate-sugar epimerase
MKVLVTGANGFIGSNLCKSLIRSRQMVVGLVRESSDIMFVEDLSALHIIKGDITDKDSLISGMKNVYIDNLVQMIILAGENKNAPGQIYNAVDDGKITWKQYIDWMCEDADRSRGNYLFI